MIAGIFHFPNLVDERNLNKIPSRSKPIRKSKADAAETRAEILAAATRAFKRQGFSGVGMADLMGEIGLSHGAAYRHFASKDALIAACLADAGATSVRGAAKAQTRQAFLDRYLAESPVQDAALGCSFAALAVDVARAGDPALHAMFASGLQELAAAMQENIPALDRAGALRLIAQAAGALLLARAAGGTPMAASIRDACLTDEV